jgi:hypothetical protein
MGQAEAVAPLDGMGGIARPCASVAFAVLGEGQTLNHYAEVAEWNGAPMDRRTALGLLVGSLGGLEAAYKEIDRTGLDRLEEARKKHYLQYYS